MRPHRWFSEFGSTSDFGLQTVAVIKIRKLINYSVIYLHYDTMLRRFSVQNYKNFQNRVTLDFTKTRDYHYNLSCVKDGLLNKVLIMGRNASGKTNLGYALFDIVYTLTEKLSIDHQKDKISFINGATNSPEASFYYEFQYGEDVIEYEYHKTEPFIITYESLRMNDRTIFKFDYHTGTKITDGLSDYNAGNLDFGSVDGSLSVLKYIARSTPQTNGSPMHFVMDFVSHMLYFRCTYDGNRFIGFFEGSEFMNEFIMNNNLVHDFEEFLHNTGGVDIRLDVESNSFQKTLVQRLKYKTIPFEYNKSSGTHSLELYYYWSKKFDTVSFLFIDEFDAYYHYELAEKIIRHAVESVNVQTIFTSHNLTLVDNSIMRPDCYLLLDKGKIRSLVDSTSRELREAHNLAKMLHNGEFDE